MEKELLSQIKKHETIIIQRHQKPDGDALGSQFGLKEILKDKFPLKEILVLGSREEIQNNPLSKIFSDNFDDVSIEKYNNSLVIVVDTANIERIEGINFFRGKTIFKIDHHSSGEVYGQYEWVEPKTSSTSEMIARWARENKLTISSKAAKYMLTGMITDTGRFVFNSVTSKTLFEASNLINCGAKIYKIAGSLNDRDIKLTRLQGLILSNFTFEDGISYYVLPKGIENDFGVDYASASSMVFLLMSFSESEYAVYLSYDSENDIWKGSLRSRKKPINKIAEMFGGGGHEMASGFKLKNENQINDVINELKKIKNT